MELLLLYLINIMCFLTGYKIGRKSKKNNYD